MVTEVTPAQAWNILRENPDAILLDVQNNGTVTYGHL